jgi:hypothetical protein
MLNIGEHSDYTLGQKVVMIGGDRITGLGLHENIKLTEEDQRQLFEWFKKNKPDFVRSLISGEE